MERWSSCGPDVAGSALLSAVHYSWRGELPLDNSSVGGHRLAAPYLGQSSGVMLAGDWDYTSSSYYDGGSASGSGASWGGTFTWRECSEDPPAYLRRGTQTVELDGASADYSWGWDAQQVGTAVAYADTTPWSAVFDLEWADASGFAFQNEPLPGSFVSVSMHPAPGAAAAATARLDFDCAADPTEIQSDGCGDLTVNGLPQGCWCPARSMDGGPSW